MSNPRKALGHRAEVQIAERAEQAGIKAQVQPLSGILTDFPNDVVLHMPEAIILVESKVRSATVSGGEKHITVNLDWLKGVLANALRRGMDYGIVVFRTKRSSDFYVLMRYEDYLRLHKKGDE